VQSVASAAQTTASAAVHAGHVVASVGVHAGQTTASEPMTASAAVHDGQTTASEPTTASAAVHTGHVVASVGVQVSVSFLKSPSLLLPPLDVVLLVSVVVLLDTVVEGATTYSNIGKSTPIMTNLLVTSSYVAPVTSPTGST